MKTLYLPTDPVQQVVTRIEQFRDLGATGLEADCLLLVGTSGRGKSRILRHLKEAMPDAGDGPTLIRPMVLSELPARTTIKAAAETLWNDLGSVEYLKGSLPTMTNHVIGRIQERHTTFIAFDETHHIVDKRSKEVTYDVGEWFKGLLNRGHCPILLVGMPRLVRLIETNPQLARRCSDIVELHGCPWGSPAERLQFQAVIMGLTNAADIRGDEVGLDLRVAELVHIATFGVIGRLVKLLEISIRFAVNDGLDHLDRRHLCQAYDVIPKSQDEEDDPWPTVNPFAESGVGPRRKADSKTGNDRVIRLKAGKKQRVRLRDVLRDGPPGAKD